MTTLLIVSYTILGLFASMWIASLVAQRREEATPWVWAVIHMLLCFFVSICAASFLMQYIPPSNWKAGEPLLVVFMPIVIVTIIMFYAIKTWSGGRRVVVQSGSGVTRNPAARTRAGQEALKRLEAERKARLAARDQAGVPRPGDKPGAVKRPAAGASAGGPQVKRPPLKTKNEGEG